MSFEAFRASSFEFTFTFPPFTMMSFLLSMPSSDFSTVTFPPFMVMLSVAWRASLTAFIMMSDPFMIISSSDSTPCSLLPFILSSPFPSNITVSLLKKAAFISSVPPSESSFFVPSFAETVSCFAFSTCTAGPLELFMVTPSS